MQEVVHGSRDAYDRLYQRWSGPVFQFLCRRTGARHAAEEAHQETWLRVFKFRGRFDPRRPFRNWLYSIAANCGRDAQRPEPELLVWEPAFDEPAELGLRLVHALAQLDAFERKLFLLAVEGFDGPELAEMFGMTSGAVRMRLTRARQRLRDLVGANDA